MCVSIGSQPFVRFTENKQNSGKGVYGQIVEIFAPSETSAEGAIAVLDLFCLRTSRHPIFGMPVLSRPSGDNSHLIVHVAVSKPKTRLD
jgi:hypothetical protein